MTSSWPKTLPDDPFEAARTILSNPVPGKGLEHILGALNAFSKKPIAPDLLKGARVLDLETRKIRFLQKKFGVKLVPFVLVIPKEQFQKIAELNKLSCVGIYVSADEKAMFPFSKTGLCLIEDKKMKSLTIINAWHEIRHHIYEVRASGRSAADRSILGELFAYVVNVKAGILEWFDVGLILRKRIPLYLGAKNVLTPAFKRQLGRTSTLDKAVSALALLSDYFPQNVIDDLILQSNDLNALNRKLEEFSEKRSSPHMKEAKWYYEILVSTYHFDPKVVLSQFKKLDLQEFIAWAKEEMRRRREHGTR